jgi:hypothetical protein
MVSSGNDLASSTNPSHITVSRWPIVPTSFAGGAPVLKFTLHDLFAAACRPRLDGDPATLDQILEVLPNAGFSTFDESLQLCAQLTGVTMRRVYAVDPRIYLSVVVLQLG